MLFEEVVTSIALGFHAIVKRSNQRYSSDQRSKTQNAAI